jgi:uroporphyrinogen decarboxylase
MTDKELVVKQLKHEETPYTPYGRMEFDEKLKQKMDQAYGSKSWQERINNSLLYTGGITIEVEGERKPGHKYIDIYGVGWETTDTCDYVIDSPIKEPSVKALKSLKLPSAEEAIPDHILKRVNQTCKNDPDKFIVATWFSTLFERCWYLCGFENAYYYLAAEPKFFMELLNKMAEHQLAILERYLLTDVDGIYTMDDWGDQRGVTMGKEKWRIFIKPYLKNFCARVHEGGKYMIHHCCGNMEAIIDDIAEAGVDCLQSMQPEAIDPYKTKEKYGKKMAFWGALGSQSIIPFGKPEEIKKEVGKLTKEMGRGGGYILGPAKPIGYDTPVENAFAILESFNNARNEPAGR